MRPLRVTSYQILLRKIFPVISLSNLNHACASVPVGNMAMQGLNAGVELLAQLPQPPTISFHGSAEEEVAHTGWSLWVRA